MVNDEDICMKGVNFLHDEPFLFDDGITDENLSSLALLVRHFNTSCDKIQDFKEIQKLIRKIQISENSSAKKRCPTIL